MFDFLHDLSAYFARPLNYPAFLVPWVFIAGGIVGSLLNVCIYRLPLEKSILWPSSRCLKCLHPIRWLDNLPLIGYLRLKGRCRHCGQQYSSRYFWIELLTASAFALTFWNLMAQDVVQPAIAGEVNYFQGADKATLLLMWLSQAFFLSFLIVVTFTDADHKQIPLTVTIPGTAIGILYSLVLPWPAPMSLKFLPPPGATFGGFGLNPESIYFLSTGASAQPWPVWLPLGDWLAPGTWQMGLATSVAGALVGTLLIRAIRWVFGWGFGKEAMGIGDADLLMMIGAFLGWQACFLVLLFAVAFALVYAIGAFVVNRGQELPFGPFLAGAAALLVWGPRFSFILSQKFFFDGMFLVLIGAASAAMALLICFLIRAARLIRMAG